MEKKNELLLKEKYVCPYCGEEITQWIFSWIEDAKKDHNERTSFMNLVESIRELEKKRIESGDEKDYDEVDYEDLERIYNVKSNKAHKKRVARIQKEIGKMQEDADGGKHTSESKRELCSRIREEKKKKIDMMFRDESMHEELIRLTTCNADSKRTNIAYTMFSKLITASAERNADKLFLYKDHSRELYIDVNSVEDVTRLIAKYKRLAKMHLYCKRYDITDDKFVCGLFYMPTERCVASIVWILNVDVTKMFEDTDVALNMVKELKMKEMKEKLDGNNQ